jgi:hypothetical protein
MSYTNEMTEFMTEQYLSLRNQGLTNSETVASILSDERFSEKNAKSVIAKLGTLKIYKPDVEQKGTSKTDLVNEYISLTNLPKRHHENLMRLNKPTLDDMVESVKGLINAD